MDKTAESALVFGGFNVTVCPWFDRANVSWIIDQRYDDCRILEVVLNDGRSCRIDSRTSGISIDEAMFWLRGGK